MLTEAQLISRLHYLKNLWFDWVCLKACLKPFWINIKQNVLFDKMGGKISLKNLNLKQQDFCLKMCNFKFIY